MDCRKILSRWSAQEFYVYLRPITSKFLDRSKKHTVYWKVSVEYRTIPPGKWAAEGFSLAEVIRELDQVVPRKRGGRRIDQSRSPGWCAPEKMQRKAIKKARKARKQRERE